MSDTSDNTAYYQLETKYLKVNTFRSGETMNDLRCAGVANAKGDNVGPTPTPSTPPSPPAKPLLTY